ncbi:MAG TPA: RNA-binding S4 domain-containing protein [Stellaceae bacterium]|nr:RNA-binding S4 domain-containing protein [Stellaceae bacterium]
MCAPEGLEAAESGSDTLRLDKWLWFARFFKSRARAAALCEAGLLRRNHVVVRKAHQPVRPGDVLTFPQGAQIRVVRVLALAGRRGPAGAARLLYDDLAPPPAAAPPSEPAAPAVRAPGSGRPTKRERRAIDRLVEDS